MCLRTIIRELNKDEREGIGWKVFSKYRLSNKLSCQYYPISRRGYGWEVPTNKWIKARRLRLFTGRSPDFTEYISGFHIWRTREAAREWSKDNQIDTGNSNCIRKVMYQKGRILGIQGGNGVIVADQMLVLDGTKG